jgi:hypothetical protein
MQSIGGIVERMVRSWLGFIGMRNIFMDEATTMARVIEIKRH